MDKLKELLNNQKENIKHYSILIPIVKESNELVFEVRASTINHPGEICFPGGKVEEDEDYQQAAIRETCEELLITESQIEVLGKLPTFIDPNGRHLHLFVGIIHDYTSTYSKAEVDHLIIKPIDELLNMNPETYVTYIETHLDEAFPYHYIPEGKNYPFLKKKRIMYFYPINQEVIWGLTAEILHQFLEVYKQTKD